MVYHVGRPAMFEGNRFLPETGTPIWKIVRNKTVLADCEPDPLTVATWRLKSLTTRFLSWRLADSRAPISVVAMNIHPQFPIRLFCGKPDVVPGPGTNINGDFCGAPKCPEGRCLSRPADHDSSQRRTLLIIRHSDLQGKCRQGQRVGAIYSVLKYIAIFRYLS